MIGKRTDADFNYPELDVVQHHFTVKAALSGLPPLKAGKV